MELTKKRVVITGIGVVASNGIGINAYKHALENGISGIKYINDLEQYQIGSKIGGVPIVLDNDIAPYFKGLDLQKVSTIQKYTCLAAVEAWKNAGLEIPDFESETDWDTGLILGTGMGSIDILEDKILSFATHKKARLFGSTTVEQAMVSGLSAYISGLLALGNHCLTISNACITSTDVLMIGYERIKKGDAKRMVVGGAEIYSPHIHAGFDAMMVLNQKSNHAPEQASCPMSQSAAGFVLGAGAGILIIEDLETALERNAPIYAEILGGYVNCGGQRSGGTMTFPNNKGVITCIERAMQNSNIASNEIDLINGHLTGTKVDPIEIANWVQALKLGGTNFPTIQSTKSMIGHCLGAAGSLELIALVLQLQHQFIHPSINCHNPHPDILKQISANCIPQTMLKKPNLNIAIKSNFGFGDVNGCTVLKRWEA